ncbi:MAG: PorP/SprF family type IX secretion system membrane protein [Bacteroidia bacterium]
MINIRNIVCTALLATCFATEMVAQQDPQYSQYMFNPLSANPAYAGSRGVLNGAVLFRKQWVGFGDGAPSTQVLAINTPTRRGKVGLGLEIVADQIGPKKTTGFYLNYAYRIPLGKGKLAFGLGAGIINSQINWGLISYKDQGDVYSGLGSTSQTFPDFKFGMFFNNKNFFIGASVTHLNESVYGVSTLNAANTARFRRHAFFTFGRAFSLGSNVLFSPSVMMRGVTGVAAAASADVNLNFKIKNTLWLGLSFRSEKSVIALVQYNITEKFKVGYSYDMTFNGLKRYQSGSHEIMLGFDLNLFNAQVLSPRYF